MKLSKKAMLALGSALEMLMLAHYLMELGWTDMAVAATMAGNLLLDLFVVLKAR